MQFKVIVININMSWELFLYIEYLKILLLDMIIKSL